MGRTTPHTTAASTLRKAAKNIKFLSEKEAMELERQVLLFFGTQSAIKGKGFENGRKVLKTNKRGNKTQSNATYDEIILETTPKKLKNIIIELLVLDYSTPALFFASLIFYLREKKYIIPNRTKAVHNAITNLIPEPYKTRAGTYETLVGNLNKMRKGVKYKFGGDIGFDLKEIGKYINKALK